MLLIARSMLGVTGSISPTPQIAQAFEELYRELVAEKHSELGVVRHLAVAMLLGLVADKWPEPGATVQQLDIQNLSERELFELLLKLSALPPLDKVEVIKRYNYLEQARRYRS